MMYLFKTKILHISVSLFIYFSLTIGLANAQHLDTVSIDAHIDSISLLKEERRASRVQPMGISPLSLNAYWRKGSIAINRTFDEMLSGVDTKDPYNAANDKILKYQHLQGVTGRTRAEFDSYKGLPLDELIKKVFIKSGACVSVSNISASVYNATYTNGKWSWTSQERGLGYFNAMDLNFPTNDAEGKAFKEGLILSTADVRRAEGPNTSNIDLSGGSTFKGDSDLSTLISGTIQNVAVLEFDFVPTGTSMEFKYVFASEEYPGFVNTIYNDVFGFFVHEVGKPGTKKNIAVLPGTNTPVAINTVNNGKWADYNYTQYYGNPSNSQYFVPNKSGSLLTEFNGFTKVLTARYDKLERCKTYRLKLAVANVGDRQYGSGVFLQANSFSAGDDMTVFGNEIEGMDKIYTKCDQNYIRVKRSEITNQPETVQLGYSGTAVNGIHYMQLNGNPLPTSVVIPANEGHVDIWFKASTSGANKHFIVELFCPCGGGAVSDKTVTIHEFGEIGTIAQSSSCAGTNNGSITVSGSGGSTKFQFSIYKQGNWSTWSPAADSYTFSGLPPGKYKIRMRDEGGCSENESEVEVKNLVVSAGPNITQCDATFTMAASKPFDNEVGIWGMVTYSPGLIIENPNAYNTKVIMSSGKTVTLRWTVNNGVCSDYADVVLVKNVKPIFDITNTTHVSCYGGNDGQVQLNVLNTELGVTYTYSKDGGITWQTSEIFTNLTAKDYDFVVKSSNNCVSDIKTININEPEPLLGSRDIQSNHLVVCSNANVYITILNSKVGVNYKIYKQANGGTPLNPLGANGNGNVLNILIEPQSNPVTLLYVEASKGFCTSQRIQVIVEHNGIPVVFPDLRVFACPNSGIINLSKHIDVDHVDPNLLKWEAMHPSTPAITTNQGLVNSADFVPSNVYIYKYKVTNQCITDHERTLYLKVLDNNVSIPQEKVVSICKDHAHNLHINHKLKIDVEGSWEYVPNTTNVLNHVDLKSSPDVNEGALFFNGHGAYGHLPDHTHEGKTCKKMEFHYTPSLSNCLQGIKHKVIVIITPD